MSHNPVPSAPALAGDQGAGAGELVPLEQIRKQLNKELYSKCESSVIEGIYELLKEYKDYLKSYDRPAISYTDRALELYYYLSYGEHEDISMKDWIHKQLAGMGKSINPSDIEKLVKSFDELKAESVRRVIKACEESRQMPVADFIDKTIFKKALDRWNHEIYLASKDSPDNYCDKYYVPCKDDDDEFCDDDPCPWLDEYYERQEGARYLRGLIRDLQDKNIRANQLLWDASAIGGKYAQIIPFIEELFGAVVPYFVDLFDLGYLFDVIYNENVQLAVRMFNITKKEAEELVDAYLELPSHMPSCTCC